MLYLARREGFEPSDGLPTVGSLANCCNKPLYHRPIQLLNVPLNPLLIERDYLRLDTVSWSAVPHHFLLLTNTQSEENLEGALSNHGTFQLYAKYVLVMSVSQQYAKSLATYIMSPVATVQRAGQPRLLTSACGSIHLVLEKGLEPSRLTPRILSPVCIPVPPLQHVEVQLGIEPRLEHYKCPVLPIILPDQRRRLTFPK